MIEELISTYGLLAVFLGCMLEGETAALAGGLFAHREILITWQVAIAAASGAFVADFSIFCIARRSGNHPRLVKIMAHPRAERVLATISRNSYMTACVYRFIPGLRIIAPVALAQSTLPTVRFAAIAVTASLVWSVIYVVLGRLLSSAVSYVFYDMTRREQFSVILILALALLILGAALRLRRIKAQSIL